MFDVLKRRLTGIGLKTKRWSQARFTHFKTIRQRHIACCSRTHWFTGISGPMFVPTKICEL
ncbi:MAG: hypothetical protein AAFO68_06335, partial [Pseudomonadota bacterium]